MTLQTRIHLFEKLGQYMLGDDPSWQAACENAYRENPWFIPEFIDLAVQKIAKNFLQPDVLRDWVKPYSIPEQLASPKTIGLVMAGNIPLVGFHDVLCCFMSGHRTKVKTSTKDNVLIRHIYQQLCKWEPQVAEYIRFSDQIKGCDAYIATGSNNTGRYFEYYFGKFPHIIRKNRSSVAILDGNETKEELAALADDIQFYFGLGCRNITKIFVPEDYDFIPLLDELKRYEHFMDFHKYKHNYDYHLAILIMGNKYYMNNGSIILTENIAVFSPVSQVHYEKYADPTLVEVLLKDNDEIQCIVGHGHTPFGAAQSPSLKDYADGVDTMQFLTAL